MCRRLTATGITQINLRDQVRKSTLSTSEISNKLSLAEAKVSHLEAQVTFLTKDKEELSDFLEDTHRAKMMYGADLYQLQENWLKDKEKIHSKVFN